MVALDLGSRRIGVAVSDSGGMLATPHSVITRAGDPVADRAAIAAVVEEVGAERVVVGLPTSLDGTAGPAALAAEAEARALETFLRVPVELHDERLTTVSANRSLSEAGVKGRKRRSVVDQVAATILLQSWLDSRR